MKKVLIGLNSYQDLPFLRKILPVLENLRVSLPADVVIMDTAWDDDVKEYIIKHFPEMKLTRHKDGNLGYGRSYNEILLALPHHEYFLLVTSDVYLEADIVKKFVERMDADKSISMCSGKLYYWNAETGEKTNRIDSFGIMAEKRHHFYDRGQGEVDKGQYDDLLDEAFGISGAVFLIRTSVIKGLHENGKALFDERMWMYKEDIDLAYRLRWLKEKIVIFPEVWGYHARTVANRDGQSASALAHADKNKKDYGRMHSYRNHFLMIKNNFTLSYGFGITVRVLFYECLKGAYMLLKHPRVFFAGLKVLFFVKGAPCEHIASASEMRKYFK